MRFTRLISVAVVVSSLSLASAACSSSSSSNGGGGGGDCGSFASAVCQKLSTCFSFGLQAAYGTAAECTSRFAALCQSGMQEPGISMDASFLSKCTAAYNGATCDQFETVGTLPGCAPSPGTFANGQACGDDAQCQSLFCNKAGATCGTCAAAPKAGDACTGSCGSGLQCVSGKCAAPTTPGALGAACSDTTPCSSNLTCFNGKCSAPTAAGQPCDQTKPACDASQGYLCLSGACTQVKLANAGEACGFSNSQYTACAANGKCNTPSGSTTGTCVAAADDGQACDATNGPNCKTGASCVNGKCTLDAATTCK